MGEIVRRQYPIVTRRYARLDLPNGGFTTDFKNFTDTDHVVEVEVDLVGLARILGARAVRSKGGKAIVASGLIVVKRIK